MNFWFGVAGRHLPGELASVWSTDMTAILFKQIVDKALDFLMALQYLIVCVIDGIFISHQYDGVGCS